jgi:hypothetical protein
MYDKQDWPPGQVPKFTIPQCADCINNEWFEAAGILTCREYGIRPQKFVDNNEKCPLRRPERVERS